MRHLVSALSTAAVAAIATLGVLLPSPAVAQSAAPTFVQGTAFSTPRFSTITVTLSRPVAQGDLLVGWVSQYNAPEEIQVADNVNGTWTRAPAALTFGDDTGDIALYYRENSQAAPAGLTITLSVSSPAYWEGAVADYSGVALAGALDQIVSKRFPDGSSVDTGPTAAVGAGELVFAALIASPSAGSVTPGRGQPPFPPSPTGTRCAPSSIPIPLRRPCLPPPPPASRPRARPPHGSPSRGRPPRRAASPAMPCTATVPPSA